MLLLQGWFWWFNAEQRKRVRQLQKPERAARAVVERLNREHMAQLSEAKKELGVWSSLGTEESRALFWWALSHALRNVALGGPSVGGASQPADHDELNPRVLAGTRSKLVKSMVAARPCGT